MSVVWDLLCMDDNRHGRSDAERVQTASREGAERRLSPRSSVYVPVFVYGYASQEQPFHESTNTLQVNANGGLLRLEARVQHGQKLLVMNRITQEEQECYVVSLVKRPKHADLRVGIALSKSSPEFWDTRKRA